MASSRRPLYVLCLLGSLTFMAVANVFYVLSRYTDPFSPYLLSAIIGSVSYELYLGVSIAVTMVFLSATLMSFVSISSSGKILPVMENLIAVNKEVLHVNNVNAGATTKALQESMVGQQQVIASFQEMQIELANTLDRQQQIEKRIGQLSQNIEQAILELQTSLQLPEPVLTGQSSPKELKGIGPKTAAALEDLNIMTVTDFLVANPLDVSKHTRLTHEQIEQLRNSIQLLMIPNLSYSDLTLLEEVGVTTRRDLATQDPLELNLMLSNVAQSYVDTQQLSNEEIPTLEEILLWVRVAKR